MVRRTKAKRVARPEVSTVAAALCAAGLSIAAHVIGKAIRDTLYLATFRIEHLPYFFLGTGVLSGIAVSIYTRLNTVFSPQRVVPALAGLSAVILSLLWLGTRTGAPWVIAVLYVWTSISSTFLVSGFWTVFGERFDPRAARKLFGVVGMATTVGGVVGGVGSHALLRVMTPESLLLALTVVELLTALAVFRLAPSSGPVDARMAKGAAGDATSRTTGEPEVNVGLLGGVRELLATPYLRNIMLFAGGLTIAGTLCDYVLKDAASRELSGKQEIAEFFSLFHGTVSAVTLGVQVLLSGPLVAKKGIAAALVALPLWLMTGAATLLSAPLLWVATALRGGENAVRNSFYRAGYELLFVPLPPAQKRVSKPILDALGERLADAVGAGIVLLLVTAIGLPAQSLVWVVLVIGALTLALVMRMRRGYVDTLSTSLVQHAVELDEVAHAAGDDATTRDALRTTLLGVNRDRLHQKMRRSQAGLSLIRSLNIELPEDVRGSLKKPPPGPGRTLVSGGSKRGASAEDPVIAQIRRMIGADPQATRAAIAAWDGHDRRLLPFLVRLLARDDLYQEIVAALSKAGDAVAGTLADHLADPDEDFAARRRIPRVLAACRSDVAMSALLHGLVDERFEVRYQCAVALDRIQTSGGQRPPLERAWAAIRDEVKKSRTMWEAQRLLEEPEVAEDPWLTGAVQRRGAHSLRHVFRLLGLVLEDPKTLEVSFRAVHADDPHFRAVGLEYLENVLPPDVKDALWPLIGDDETPPLSRPGRALAEVMAELTASSGHAVPPNGVSLREAVKEVLAEAPVSNPVPAPPEAAPSKP